MVLILMRIFLPVRMESGLSNMAEAAATVTAAFFSFHRAPAGTDGRDHRYFIQMIRISQRQIRSASRQEVLEVMVVRVAIPFFHGGAGSRGAMEVPGG